MKSSSIVLNLSFRFGFLKALLQYIRGLNIPGAVLIFLPGWNLIFAMMRNLQDHPVFGKSSPLISIARKALRCRSAVLPLGSATEDVENCTIRMFVPVH